MSISGGSGKCMMRMYPPGSDEEFDGKKMARFNNVDKQYYIMKMDNKFRDAMKDTEARNVRVKKRLRKRLITRY